MDGLTSRLVSEREPARDLVRCVKDRRLKVPPPSPPSISSTELCNGLDPFYRGATVSLDVSETMLTPSLTVAQRSVIYRLVRDPGGITPSRACSGSPTSPKEGGNSIPAARRIGSNVVSVAVAFSSVVEAPVNVIGSLRLASARITGSSARPRGLVSDHAVTDTITVLTLGVVLGTSSISEASAVRVTTTARFPTGSLPSLIGCDTRQRHRRNGDRKRITSLGKVVPLMVHDGGRGLEVSRGGREHGSTDDRYRNSRRGFPTES